MKLKLVKYSSQFDRKKLYRMRLDLVKATDPLRSDGADLQEILLQCNRIAIRDLAVS